MTYLRDIQRQKARSAVRGSGIVYESASFAWELLYSSELPQRLFVKVVKSKYVVKATTWFEDVYHFVGFHHTPVVCQSEIADDPQAFFSLRFVINNKTPLLQGLYLLRIDMGCFVYAIGL